MPSFDGQDSVYLAVGIIGATVMPHVIYLHSALTQGRIKTRTDAEKIKLSKLNKIDVIGAMGFAGIINMSMLAVAAALPEDAAQDGPRVQQLLVAVLLVLFMTPINRNIQERESHLARLRQQAVEEEQLET